MYYRTFDLDIKLNVSFFQDIKKKNSVVLYSYVWNIPFLKVGEWLTTAKEVKPVVKEIVLQVS